jgi:tRNA A-37 threonylcarbamoyl transferase component Bud32/HAMP domain-containing protein
MVVQEQVRVGGGAAGPAGAGLVKDKVGRYQMHEMIGQGAMASVYKAFDPEINRTLAIKLLKPELCHEDEYRSRFVREAKGAGLLSHPNIVTVYDVGGTEHQPYIAMELVEGRTLAEVLKEKKQLPLKTIIEIGIQLAKALGYAHSNGIVHRDVKPGNIMMVKGSSTVKVADFGICRIEGGDATQKTRIGDVLGTPNYMSPEQVMGQQVDSRSDLFSTGVVLYELLTGKLPFKADTLVSVALKIVKEDPESIDALRPDLPLSLRRIIDRCLKKQPDKRYQTGEELAKALIAVLRQLPSVEKKTHGVPMGVRWAILMAVIVASTMSITTFFIQQRQFEALMGQVLSYGGSLAKFMATQSGEAVLGEDWVALEVFIQETMNRQNFAYLEIVDHTGVVRGSSVAGETGARFVERAGTAVTTREAGVTIRRTGLADGQQVLDFSAPVQFHDRIIGTVRLGIFETPLTQVAHMTLMMLGVLIVVTSIAVAVASFLLARRLDAPMQVLRNSLEELAQGRYDYRIAAHDMKDEFGQLYAAFDETAAALQQRHEPNDQSPST